MQPVMGKTVEEGPTYLTICQPVHEVLHNRRSPLDSPAAPPKRRLCRIPSLASLLLRLRQGRRSRKRAAEAAAHHQHHRESSSRAKRMA